jgi:hypothetical protein
MVSGPDGGLLAGGAFVGLPKLNAIMRVTPASATKLASRATVKVAYRVKWSMTVS